MIGDDPAGPPARHSAGTDDAVRLPWFGALRRVWCLRSVVSAPRTGAARVIIGLGAAWLAAWVVIDHWQRQPAPEFSPDGVPVLAWYAVAVLALAGVLWACVRPRPAFRDLLVVALAAVPLPFLQISVAVYFLPPSWYEGVGCAIALYLGCFFARALEMLTGRRQIGAALAGLLFTGVFLWVSDAVDAIPDVWAPREIVDATPASEAALEDREAALFDQAAKIDEALDAIHREPGAGPQAFFLGFAGVGEQKVFSQEIGLASRILGERYHLGDRHLSLINDERDLQAAPLANVSGLAYALKGMAERMDVAQDVLILAISSHGSADPSIAVSNAQMPFTALTPDDLRAALQEAGIQWRVLVISACYAGGFIDALEDSKTIVIAAAAKDRTSFGCSNDSDLTYFGEAFYRDALPEAKSLRAAFDTAKAAIAVREHSEHETPSLPQAFFGAEIERRLQPLER